MENSRQKARYTTETDFHQLLDLMKEIKNLLDRAKTQSLQDIWIPKKEVMKYFDYGITQMYQLEKDHKIVCSKIKSRKFYSAQSILDLIEKNKIPHNDTL
jgi:hypothetical protein